MGSVGSGCDMGIKVKRRYGNGKDVNDRDVKTIKIIVKQCWQ